jgi:hypothetical protein
MKPNLVVPGKASANNYGDEWAKPEEQPKEKRPVKPMDPTLRLAAKLDRLLAGMEPEMRRWALGFLCDKYGRCDGPQEAKP